MVFGGRWMSEAEIHKFGINEQNCIKDCMADVNKSTSALIWTKALSTCDFWLFTFHKYAMWKYASFLHLVFMFRPKCTMVV